MLFCKFGADVNLETVETASLPCQFTSTEEIASFLYYFRILLSEVMQQEQTVNLKV